MSEPLDITQILRFTATTPDQRHHDGPVSVIRQMPPGTEVPPLVTYECVRVGGTKKFLAYSDELSALEPEAPLPDYAIRYFSGHTTRQYFVGNGLVAADDFVVMRGKVPRARVESEDAAVIFCRDFTADWQLEPRLRVVEPCVLCHSPAVAVAKSPLAVTEKTITFCRECGYHNAAVAPAVQVDG